MTYSQQDGARDRQPDRAAIFVDYENLYRTLGRQNGDGAARVDLISEMIEALQRSLLEDRQAQSAVARAYADFTALDGSGDRVQRALYLQGIEPHYVPDERQERTVEMQLCVDAVDLLHHRPDISTFVLLTGRRIYFPLLRAFKRYGRQVLIVGLEEPPLQGGSQIEEGWFFPARDLLSGPSRRSLTQAVRRPSTPDPSLSDVDDPILLQTLEIIDQHFGQYEEVYLTPLLRKLSELLDERRYDPKNLISELEDCRAVRLEKRQGFPHDYTVLILEEHHPSVARVLSGERVRVPHGYATDGEFEDDIELEPHRSNGRAEDYDDYWDSDEFDEASEPKQDVDESDPST